jgi:hypothetical protein
MFYCIKSHERALKRRLSDRRIRKQLEEVAELLLLC